MPGYVRISSLWTGSLLPHGGAHKQRTSYIDFDGFAGTFV